MDAKAQAFEVNIRALQQADLAGAQPMTIGGQKERLVALALNHPEQTPHLVLGQISNGLSRSAACRSSFFHIQQYDCSVAFSQQRLAI